MKKTILIATIIACSLGLHAEYVETSSAPDSYLHRFATICSHFLATVKSATTKVAHSLLSPEALACHVECFKQEVAQMKSSLMAELIPIVGATNAFYLDMLLDQLIEGQQIKSVADLGKQVLSILMQRFKNGSSMEHSFQNFNQTYVTASNTTEYELPDEL